MPILDNISAIQIGTQGIEEVQYLGQRIWPAGPQYTYELSDFVLAYYGGANMLFVNNTNYAYITAQQTKKDRGGQPVGDPVTVEMTPVFSSGEERYYAIDSEEKKIWFDRETYGTTEINERSLDKFIGSYADPNGVVHTIPTANALSITLQGNHRQEPAVLDYVTLNLSANPTSVDCKATSTTAYVSFTRNFHYVYTSGKSRYDSDHAGTAALYVGSTLKANVGNDSSTKLTFADNKHNTSTSSKTIKATYNGTTKTVTISQGADSKRHITGEIVSGSYFCSFTKSGSITAGGGSVTFAVSAGHQTQDYYVWNSDSADTRDPHTYHNVADSYSYETSTLSSRCHLSSVSGGYKISHDSMQKDETTDSYRIRFYNTASSTYSNWDSGSATNTKSVSAFTINVPSIVSVLGGTIQITGKPTYSWTSGIPPERGDTVNADSVSNVIGTGFSASGSKIVVAHNKYTIGDGRSATFSATYEGKTDTSGTISQYADSKTQDGSAITHHYIEVTNKTGGAYATESTIVFTIASTFMTEVHYKWASDGTDAGWQEIGRGSEGYNYHASGNGHTDSRYEYTKVSNTEFRVKHLNMQMRDTADVDKLSLYFTNINDSLVKTTTYTFNPTNAKTPAHYGNTVGITVGLSRDYLDCTGGSVTVSGTREKEWYEDAWASGAGGDKISKFESITSWTSITVSPTATVRGTTITIGERKHNTSSQVFTVTGKADGKTATATVERLGDSTYPGTQYTRSHYLRVEGALNTISAKGGSRKYDISAGHTLVTPTYWRSDDALYQETTTQVTDKWKYSKSGAGQSYYRNFNVNAGVESSAAYLSFDHDNMAKRVETDTISISIVSAFDSTQTFAETLAPANKVETSTPETTTAFEANNLVGIAAAGQSNIQITGVRTFKTAYKKWTSGAEEGGATGYTAVNASSVSVGSSYSWLHAVSGGKLTVDAYTATDADRTGVFSATYDGKTDSNVTITQKAREKQPAEYISFYYEPQSQYLNYLYIKNNSDRAIDVNSFYYVIDGTTTTSSAVNMHAGESRLVRGWNPNVSHLTDYGVTDATWH